MKITVRDEKGKPLGAIQIKVVDLDSKAAAKQHKQWRKLERWLLKSLAAKPQNKRVKKNPENVKTVEIKISLPDFSNWPRPREVVHRLRHPTRRTLTVLTIALLILAGGLYSLIKHSSQPPAVQAAGKTGSPKLVRDSPKFTAVLPSGKTISDLGGWARVSPPGKAPAFAYVDRLSGVHIIVSEQPLPPKFIGDTNSRVAQLAQNFNATEKFSADNVTVYIATAADGSQSVILSKANLLILIKANGTLSNDQWASYISSLQ